MLQLIIPATSSVVTSWVSLWIEHDTTLQAGALPLYTVSSIYTAFVMPKCKPCDKSIITGYDIGDIGDNFAYFLLQFGYAACELHQSDGCLLGDVLLLRLLLTHQAYRRQVYETETADGQGAEYRLRNIANDQSRHQGYEWRGRSEKQWTSQVSSR